MFRYYAGWADKVTGQTIPVGKTLPLYQTISFLKTLAEREYILFSLQILRQLDRCQCVVGVHMIDKPNNITPQLPIRVK